MDTFGSSNSFMLAISLVIQIFFLIMGGYYFLVSLFAWFYRPERKPLTNKTHTFALVVAAHNEEKVIGAMVESLQQLEYPRENYDIFVIADNCVDRTAEIARSCGAFCYERTNHNLRGKGHALEWMFDIIFGLPKKYDSIAIFDADNLVGPKFLMHMNERHNQGYKVVQGYIDSKNPHDTWISSSYSITFWTVNKLYQHARANLDLSCQLAGTGFVIDVDVLKKIGWQATCLTEDMEFTMRLVLNDYIVGWAHEAVVYDEKPLTLEQSWRQRERWMRGHADVASRFVRPLVKKAIDEKKWVPLDCVIYLLQPMRIITVGVIMILSWLQMCYPDGDIGLFKIQYLFSNPLIWNILVLFDFCYTPLIVYLEKKQFSLSLLKAYAMLAVFSLTWVPITVIGVLTKNKKDWFHTQHTREITINEMQ